eukprot:6963509-Heterocapsa_arctica.AAC.1
MVRQHHLGRDEGIQLWCVSTILDATKALKDATVRAAASGGLQTRHSQYGGNRFAHQKARGCR